MTALSFESVLRVAIRILFSFSVLSKNLVAPYTAIVRACAVHPVNPYHEISTATQPQLGAHWLPEVIIMLHM